MHLPRCSKEAATIAKTYTDFRTNRILINKLVTACQGVPAYYIAVSNPREDLSQQQHNPQRPSQQQHTLPQSTLPQSTLPQPTLPQSTLPQSTLPQYTLNLRPWRTRQTFQYTCKRTFPYLNWAVGVG